MFAPTFARLKVAAFGVLRSGPRSVLWTPENVRLGNFFYFWLHAHIRQSRSEDFRVLETARMSEWRASFPRLFEQLVVPRADVRITDRRLSLGGLQAYGTDFSRSELDAFASNMLLGPDTELSRYVGAHRDNRDLTINIRRGDYYSVARWRGDYSFDIVEYVRLAIQEAQALGPIRSIDIISDDLAWCRVKLGWLNDIAPVTMPRADAPALEQLALLATSPRLILTNSTFSYWGAYLADHIRDAGDPSAPARTWAPRFHSRAFLNGRATQLNERWAIIDDIPGGWDG